MNLGCLFLSSHNRRVPQKKGPENFAGPRCFLTSLGRYFSPSAIAALGVAHAAASHVVLDAPQALPKPLGQLMPRTPQPRLQGVLGHSEFLRSFPGRIAFHFT